MNRLELIDILSSTEEEEVYIELEDGTICDEIRIGHCDEVFDGFYTAFPAGITLKGVDNG